MKESQREGTGDGTESLEHEGSNYPGFIDNEARDEYEAILLSAYERSSPLSSTSRPTEDSTVQEDLENIVEFSDDFDYVERHHPLPRALVGTDGNCFSILGRVERALRRAGVSDEEIKQFQSEATSGDYDKLLQACMAWVDVE
jgi:hypothetical protein